MRIIIKIDFTNSGYYNDGTMANGARLSPWEKEKILFKTPRKDQGVDISKDFSFIKCAPGERVLCVQRQHPIALVVPLGLPIIVGLAMIGLLLFIPRLLPAALIPYLLNPTTTLYTTQTVISAIILVETFNFMTWYYQFYIITNKALLHKHFFTIGGFYSDVVFLEEIHQQEIIRQPPNIICDMLKIQNVYVYFHKLEREEPFIFRFPANAQIIEDLIQDITIEHRTQEAI